LETSDAVVVGHHSLKSPLCSCVSITLASVIANMEAFARHILDLDYALIDVRRDRTGASYSAVKKQILKKAKNDEH
jgi:predicted nucleic acid-binding Zn finger protein